MIAQRKKTFCISNDPLVKVSIPNVNIKPQDIEIKYFSDCVYHSLSYSVPFSLELNSIPIESQQSKTLTQIKMNFNFLVDQTKIHRKIFDNIGVINIKFNNQLLRYGILITEEKGQIFVSLIQ